MELQSGGGWKALGHTDYNYWIAQNGAGPGPFTVRVTDTAGRRTTLNGVTLTPGTIQRPGAVVADTPAPRTVAPTRSSAPPAPPASTSVEPSVTELAGRPTSAEPAAPPVQSRSRCG